MKGPTLLKILCLIKKGDKILVHQVGGSPDQDKPFFRPIGGTIEFEEQNIKALRREMREELGSELADIKPVTVFENIFEYCSKRSASSTKVHEIDFVYTAKLTRKELYDKEVVMGTGNGGVKFKLFWVSIKDIFGGRINFVPAGLGKFLPNI